MIPAHNILCTLVIAASIFPTGRTVWASRGVVEDQVQLEERKGQVDPEGDQGHGEAPGPAVPDPASEQDSGDPGPSEPIPGEQTGTIKGKVLEAGTRMPLEGVVVVVEGSELESYTDADGAFVLEDVPAGLVTLKIALPGFKGASLDLILEPGQTLVVKQYLFPRPDRRYAMTVETRRESEEATEHNVSIEEASKLPGSFGDSVRVVQNLPGAARVPYSLGFLIIRGASPFDSGYFLEGMQIPNLYHFLGVTAAINADFLDSIEYLPGGYSVRYGRLLGGIVNLDLRDMYDGPVHGYLDTDLIDTTVMVRGTAGKRLSYAVSARRSYIDYVLDPFAASWVGYEMRLPRYWDAQLALGYRPNERTQVNLLGMVSSDAFAVLGQAGTSGQSQPTAELSSQFLRLLLRVHTRFNDRLSHTLVLSAGPDSEYYQYGANYVDGTPLYLAARDEWSFAVSRALELAAGIDGMVTHHRFEITLAGTASSFQGEAWGYSPSPYLEAEWRPAPGWRLVSGVRTDSYLVPQEGFSATVVSPRLSLFWEAGDRTEWHASAGQYGQFPDETEFFDDIGNPALEAPKALQFEVGGRRNLGHLVAVEGNVFYNAMRDLVTEPEMPMLGIDDFFLSTPDMTNGELPNYSNDGLGRAYGLEFLLRRHFGEHLFGWLSYTLTRSERTSASTATIDQIRENRLQYMLAMIPKAYRDQVRWDLFDYDQTQVLTLVASYALGNRWEVGGRFMYATGNPITPASNRLFIVDTEGYVPLYDPYAGRNYERLPPYHALDLKVAKKFIFKRWWLEARLELQNVYYRKNIETWYYPYDYGKKLWIYGLPFLPVPGLRGEF